MSRFFVDRKNIEEDRITITNQDDIKHLSKVLRHKEGDHIEISDGEKYEYIIEIISITSESVEGRIIEKNIFQREPNIKITLFQGIPKQGKMETIVQKSVELGVNRIIPMFTKRTVVAEKGSFENKIQRWQKVADEAVKQCRRGIIPVVHNHIMFTGALDMMKENDCNLFFYEGEENLTLKAALREISSKNQISSVGVFIGPEGGFSDEEVALITDYGAKSVTMGKTILRVETASIAAIAMIMYELELS